MQKYSALLSLVLLLCCLAACGQPAENPPPPPEPSQTEAVPEPVPPTLEELETRQLQDLLDSMTTEEKVGQLFFVRCPEHHAVQDVQTYHLGGYILFGRDFQTDDGHWLTHDGLTAKIRSWQSAAAADTGIPLLIGTDEEGGTVVRASRDPQLFPAPFPSPQRIAGQSGDFAGDAERKSHALLELGINVNLAPVADVCTDPGSFIYFRTLGKPAQATADYTAQVTGAMRSAGIGSVLKHFPGYGNNPDTHTGIALDRRPLDSFRNGDFLPFVSGIQSGGPTTAVLVSHNIIEAVDPRLPASLSPAVHQLLRNELHFDGVVMTDDLIMKAVQAYAQDGSAAVLAIQAGNDIVLATDYRSQIPQVLAALDAGVLSPETVDTACLRVLRWKQALGLLPPVSPEK